LPPHRITALVPRPPGFEASLLRDIPRIVVSSDTMRARLERACSASVDRITIISPGIDVLPRSAGSGGPPCRILSAGALIPRKGYDVLLRSLGRLSDLDWRLTIAGPEQDPIYARGLHVLAEELGIAPRVDFIAEPDWAGVDLFALTSHDEGYGSAIAEALRRGLPVAVTNVGAVPTFVGPEAGVVAAPGDVEQLSKALRRLIFDQALRRHMAEVAWQSGQTLPTWREQAMRLAEVIA